MNARKTWCGGWGHRFDRRSVHGMRFDEQRFQCDVGRRFEQRHNRDIFQAGRCQRFHPHRLRLRKQGSERGHRTGGQTIESVSDRRLHGVVGRYGRAAQQRHHAGRDYDAVWPASSMWITMGDIKHVVKDQVSTSTTPVVFGVKQSKARNSAGRIRTVQRSWCPRRTLWMR